MESSQKGPGTNKRFWTYEEDDKLIEALLQIHKAENGFKSGYLRALEEILEKAMPGCGLLGKPHIESRLKTLKSNFGIIHEMLTGPNCSGFGWDPEKKCVVADKAVWDAYLQSHKDASTFRNKSFHHYDDLCIVYGKDRATGKHAETPADVLEEIDTEQNIGDQGIDVGDDFVGSTAFMSFTHSPQTGNSGSEGSSKRKRKSISGGDMGEAIRDAAHIVADEIRNSSTSLSNAIKEEVHEKRMGVNELLMKTTTLSMISRHKATLLITRDNAVLDVFYSISDEEKDEWVRAVLNGSI